MSCELCATDGGLLVYREADWRVVRVDDASFPAYYRVICNRHVAELTDLQRDERVRCFELMAAVERSLRELLKPAKINLASLGNMVPHLHWHVIARFAWDSHFPQPIWGVAQRALDAPAAGRLERAIAEVDRVMAALLGGR